MARISEILRDLRRLVTGIGRDFATWPAPGPRLIDEIECTLSVVLAIFFAHLLGAQNVGWAAFSGYVVMRAHIYESFKRGALRVAGTAAGSISAWLLARELALTPLLLSLALALVGGATMYLSLVSRRGYAWGMTGVTFAMVLIGAQEYSGEALTALAQSRFVEVCAGTFACLLVSALSTVTLRRCLPVALRAPLKTPPVISITWHKDAFRHALQGAVALSLLPWAGIWLGIGTLAQAGVTIMAAMMVPIASLTSSHHPTTAKLLHRFIGCVSGGLIATGILFTSYQLPWVMTLAVCVGVIAGRHIENGTLGIEYIGTQFTLAFLVVLVPDTYTSIDIQPGFERLAGVALGMVLLEPVLQFFHRMLHTRPVTAP